MSRNPGQPRGASPSDWAAILIVTAVAYWNALDVPFVFDDATNITQNPYVRIEGFDLPGIARAAFESRSPRPLANATFAVNHAVCGFEVRCYRAVNVAIHAAVGVLVYAIGLLLFLRLRPDDSRAARNLSLLAALVFVAHPIQIQSVTYVVQRMTSLATLLYLLSLWLWLRGRSWEAGPERTRAWVLAAVCGVLAFGSKQIAVTLPLAIALVEWVFFQDARTDWLRRRIVPASAVAAAVLALGVGYLALLGFPGYEDRAFTMGERVLTQLRVVPFYLGLLFWPHPERFNLIHWFEPSRSLFDPVTTVLGGAFLLALLAFGLQAVRRERVLGFAVLWLFLQLALESSFLPLEMAYEHRLYLPLFGISMAVAELAWRLTGRRERWLAIVAVALVGALVLSTHLRHRVWQDPEILWKDVARKSPQDGRAYVNLVFLWRARGQLAEGDAWLERLLDRDPTIAEGWHVRGMAADWQGRPDDALADYRRARALEPENPFYALKEGLMIAREDAASGLAILRQLVADHPRWVRGWFALGVTLEQQGRLEEALEAYRETLARNPNHDDAHVRVATAAANAGRFAEAAHHLGEALRVNPYDARLQELVAKARARARARAQNAREGE